MTLAPSAAPFVLSAQFFGQQVPAMQPNSFELTQQEYAHDVMKLTYWADQVDSDSYSSGMPVLVNYGRMAAQRTFFGYVVQAQAFSNALAGTDKAGRNSTCITCFGASWRMRQRGTLSWSNQTASQVMQQIAAIFNLSSFIVPHTTVWASLQMAGKSFMSFCSALAKRIGYTFYCSGVQLVFKPRQTDPNNLTGNVVMYDYRSDFSNLPIFSPVLGATSLNGGQLLNRQLVGIDPRTTQVVYSSVSGSPAPTTLGVQANTPYFTHTEHFSVNSQDEANAKVQGAGLLNQLYITATATSSGNSSISQGSLIYVSNANGSQNGLWFTTKAVHAMTQENYTTNLYLGRDSLGNTSSIGISPPTASLPVATLINGVWEGS